MPSHHPLAGVYAAAITPLNEDHSIALNDIPSYLAFLAQRGCHGALLLGTTGEGPSFSDEERYAAFKVATAVRQEYPDFRLLAGTGTPSLEETIDLTKSAFDMGFEGAVTLPPYYFYQADEDGIFYWFAELIRRAVPSDGYLLGYHFPFQARVPIPERVLARLRDQFPSQFAGVKDSTTEAEHTYKIGTALDPNFLALVGNDSLLADTLQIGASGCITALANLHSPSLRKIWDAHQQGQTDPAAQAYIDAQRMVLNKYAPFPPSVKALVARIHGFPLWPVKLPLRSLSPEQTEQAYQEIESIGRES